MDLITSLVKQGNIRGITLNTQQIDLFNIIAQAQSEEEAIEEVNEYLMDILQVSKLSTEMNFKGLSTEQKIKMVIEKARCSVLDKDKFLEFLLKHKMQIRANWNSREHLEKLFQDKEVDITYIEEVLNLKKYFVYQTHGILTFLVDRDGKTIDLESKKINVDKDKTYQKVEALYDYITGYLENGENRFTRLTLDGQGKFGTVAGVMSTEQEAKAKPQDYNLEPLIQGYEFAKRHGMNEVHINALVFFKDFPNRLVGGTKEQYITALVNYGKAVASIAKEYEVQGIHTVVDMFNEFVDYYAPFSVRTNNWMSKLSIDDLCKIASAIKSEMPNTDFGYNDWNFENFDKRKTIFEVIRKIQEYEKENGCKILDYIGTQCHTSINEIEGLRQSLEELLQFGLPIDITKLDISKGLDGVDYKTATPEELNAIRKYEQKLQNEIIKMLSNFAREGKIRAITSWSITDELCCDFCDGKEASITGMTYNGNNGFTFFGKDMDTVIEMSEEEIRLIQQHKERVRKIRENEVNRNPIQDFCYHTHTERCGHGAKDTGDEEWVQHAIKGGIKKLAFTDHIPTPDGYNKIPNSRMDISEVESYLTSIRYLQEKYKGQIEIESGFEFEYSNRDLTHLQELKSRTDKMILGQHFVVDAIGREHGITRGKNGEAISDNVLDLYAESIISAMDKGLPDVIAHPDLFMKGREYFGQKEKEIARAICKKAAEKGVPLEINLGEIATKVNSNLSIEELKKRIPYPLSEFWKIVAEETKIARENGQNLFVIFGKDVHYPGQLSTQRDYEIAIEILGIETLRQLNFVDKDFNLDNNIIARLLETSNKNKRVLIGETVKGFARQPEVAEQKEYASGQLASLFVAKEKEEDNKTMEED